MARKSPNRSGRPKRNLALVILGQGLRVFGVGVYLAVAAGVFALAYWRIDDLTGRFQGKAGDARAALEASEDATLFVNLVRARLIVPRESDSGLDMVPPDYVLIRRANGGRQDEEEDGVSESEQETLLKALYDSAAGTIVRTQVSLWNGTRRLAAVRDDRTLRPEEANKLQWEATSEEGTGKQSNNLVPETFGFINRDQIPKGMSDWFAVPVARENERIVFKSRVGSHSGTIRVQVIGRPVRVPQGARVERRTYDFFAQKGELKWACKTVAEAAVVTMQVRPDTPIEIMVEPAANCSPGVFGLAISMTGEDLAGRPRQRRRKGGRPNAKDPGIVTTGTIEWTYNWRPVERPRAPSGGDKLFVVRTADGVALTDPNGRGTPTQEAVTMGLVSLLGYGRADSTSLIGLLSQSKLPGGNTEVALTIDSRVQKIVQGTLEHHLLNVIENKDRPRRYFHDRRASITVLDVETGAVLAIGSWPLVPLGARPWDYVSYQITNPNKDPTMVASWQLLSPDNTPGSTWKTLTSLSAALEASDSAVNPDPAIGQMILGMDAGTFARRLGIPISASTVPIPGSSRSISNIMGGAMSAGGQLRAPVCTDTGQATMDSTLTVATALKKSYNVYFARLAMLLEERHVNAWIRSLPRNRAGRVTEDIKTLPPTRMMIRLKEIGLDWNEPVDLGANLAERQPLARIKGRAVLDKLYVRPPITAITRGVNLLRDNPPEAYRPEYLHRIGLNGIGQSWSVSTMHLAHTTAMIAKGALVRPYIISQWGRDRLAPPKPPAGGDDRLKIRSDLLNAIRTGMKAVTESPDGTATGVYQRDPVFVLGEVFARSPGIKARAAAVRNATAKNGVKPIWCRAYGKTGTADPPKPRGHRYNSGWFTSWKEPLQPGGKRFAIACMVTHLDTANIRFGGSVCGSIVRDIMISLEIMERPDLRANPGEDEPRPPPDDPPEGTEGETDDERPGAN
jgi:cell division protein FtsI/penicillin-binding protein 2